MFAEQLAQEARKSNWNVTRLKPMNESLDLLKDGSDVVVLISSVFGEGVPPDNAKHFVEAAVNGKLEGNEKKKRFAVFGLGMLRFKFSR